MMYVRNEIQSSGLQFNLTGFYGSPPPPAPTASIIGVGTMLPNATCQWYISTGLNYTSVSWSVNGTTVGSNWDLYHSEGSSFLLEVTATDGTETVFASKNVTVSSEANTCYIE
ncbi:MAG: hypothetical protein ACO1Q7_20375 [Gemmatimonas sp.]